MYQPALQDKGNLFGPPSLSGDAFLDDQDAGLDLGGLVLFLGRKWRLILGTAVAVALLTTLVLLQMTPRYSATASVAIQSQKTQVVDIKDVLSGLSPDQATMETQASILRSTRLTAMLIDKLHLDRDPEFNRALKRANGAFSVTDPSTWLGTSKASASATRQGDSDVLAERSQLISDVQKVINVATVARSYIINVTATSESPARAAQIANGLADIYITDGIAAKYDATRKASAYLQQKVDELRSQTVATDRAAEGYRARAGLVASDQGSTIASQQMTELSSQLITARAERAAQEAQLAQIRRLRAGSGDGGVEASGAILQSPLIQRLREQESEVVRKLGELHATYGERHPKIINAEAELRDLRAKIGDEVGKVAASTANDVSISRAREATIAASLGRVQGAVTAGGAASVRLRELQRESDANRSIYEVFLSRLKETNQQVDLQQADARIVSNADLPLRASFPKITLTMAAAIVLGLLAGVALAFAVELLDNTVRSASYLEALGGGATLAFVATVKNNGKPPEDIVFDRPGSMVPEALRTLRSALALSDVDNPPQMVLFSSSVPAEGKTFISTGLARITAQAGQKAIIVDCDLRHPRVHKALGLSNDIGLVQVLGGKSTFEEALQKDAKTDLDILVAGKGAINPPDMIRSEQMAQLFKRLRETYDLIIIDSPPFAPLTDSQILSHMVDKMVLVVRWGETPLPVVQNTIKQIHRVRAPLAGSVLSQVNIARHAGYGYGDYGYSYSKYSKYYGTAS